MTLARAKSSLSAPDYFVMQRVNRWAPPRWIRWWMMWATRGGNGWLWALCGVAVLAMGDDLKYIATATAAIAAATGVLIFIALKRAVGRERPCSIEPHCWATLLPPDRFSFPSGHSITAFAVAVSLGLFYPTALPALLLCALSVACSRILLGMHFLSDVIAGSILGAALGWLAFCFMK